MKSTLILFPFDEQQVVTDHIIDHYGTQQSALKLLHEHRWWKKWGGAATAHAAPGVAAADPAPAAAPGVAAPAAAAAAPSGHGTGSAPGPEKAFKRLDTRALVWPEALLKDFRTVFLERKTFPLVACMRPLLGK